MPLVALKWAMSLDGKIATATGDSKWITGEAARAKAHLLRAHYDAVLVGIGTVLADDPGLNARIGTPDESAAIRQPRRVVLDSSARTPLTGRLWTERPAGPLTVVACASSNQDANERIRILRDLGAEVIEVEPDAFGRASVVMAARELSLRGALSVFVEGGSRVLGSCVDESLADRAHVFIAPKVLGGEKSKSPLSGRGIEHVANALRFLEGSTTSQSIGPDVLIEGALTAWGQL